MIENNPPNGVAPSASGRNEKTPCDNRRLNLTSARGSHISQLTPTLCSSKGHKRKGESPPRFPSKDRLTFDSNTYKTIDIEVKKRKNSTKVNGGNGFNCTTLAKKLASAIGERSIDIKDLKNTGKKKTNRTLIVKESSSQ